MRKRKNLLRDKKSESSNNKNIVNSHVSLSFVKLKYESSTVILFVGIRYSVRDLLSDLNNYA